jgi:hypothetical protein
MRADGGMLKLTVLACRYFADAPERAWTCTVSLQRGDRHILYVICLHCEPRAPARRNSNSVYTTHHRHNVREGLGVFPVS